MASIAVRYLRLLCLLHVTAACCVAQTAAPTATAYKIDRDILYRDEQDLTDAARERCRLDVYYPVDEEGFATVVWFHGGGLTSGNRFIPEALKEKGFAIVAANYRLHPQVNSPVYIEDAAAAVAWTMKNISQYGGSPKRVIVSGHSAGGFLTCMVGLDKQYLAAHGIDANSLAGLAPYSAQVITHFTVRDERGIAREQPVIDNMAPLYHIRKDAPPLLLITGDRELELLGRYEENAYLWRMMQVIGHPCTELRELEGFNHGEMPEPAHPLLVKFVRSLQH
ncbi:MAG: alpha/beta hydrolase [Pirellulaceae bacterium]|nr:alpha/beta hydrolase [Planctomycetales bacterium]